MSAIDVIARAQAASAISKYGKALLFRKKTVGAHDSATHTLANGENTYSIKTLLEEYSQYLVNGTTVQAGDLKLTLAAKGNQIPEIGWTVDLYVGTTLTKYSIVSVSAVYSGEQVALYICQVRK